jgi:hypothetical protein
MGINANPVSRTRYINHLISTQNLPTTLTPLGYHTKNWNDTEKLFSLYHLNFSHDFGLVFHFLYAWG